MDDERTSPEKGPGFIIWMLTIGLVLLTLLPVAWLFSHITDEQMDKLCGTDDPRKL